MGFGFFVQNTSARVLAKEMYRGNPLNGFAHFT